MTKEHAPRSVIPSESPPSTRASQVESTVAPLIANLIYSRTEENTQALEAQAMQIAALRRRMTLMETVNVVYVHPRLGDSPKATFGERFRRISAKLDELRSAMDGEDDVEIHALLVSLRKDLKAIRDANGVPKARRFAIGYLHDALAFTPFERIDLAAVDAFASVSASAFDTEPMNPAALDSIRHELENAGFDTFPAVDNE